MNTRQNRITANLLRQFLDENQGEECTVTPELMEEIKVIETIMRKRAKE